MEDECELTSESQYSVSTRNSSHSPFMMKMKQSAQFEHKRTMEARKPSTHKLKVKKAPSDKPKRTVRRTRIDDLYENIEDKSSVIERAEQLMTTLAAAELPFFSKSMLPSNVSHGFWMILPKTFCDLHLPKHDATIVLVAENEMEYKTNFLLERHGLSGGWRGFALDNRLLKGDILVFHLIEACKLKVHIVRVYGLELVDAALCLMNLDAFEKKTLSEDSTQKDSKRKSKKGKIMQPVLLDVHIPRNYRTIRVSSNHMRLTIENRSNNTSEDSGSVGGCDLTNPHQSSN